MAQVGGTAGNDFIHRPGDGKVPKGMVDIALLTDKGDEIDPGAGEDTILCGNGADTILFGANLSALDLVNGGQGLNTIVLDGDYSSPRTLDENRLIFVDDIQLAKGHSYSFDLIHSDRRVFYSDSYTIHGESLGADNALTLDLTQAANGYLIYGGQGNDVVMGGSHSFEGGPSYIIFNAGAGNDSVSSSSGIIYFDGGDGNDRVEATGTTSGYYSAGEGADTLVVSTTGNCTFDAGGGNDNVIVNGGLLKGRFERHGSVHEFMVGGTGIDTLSLSGSIAIESFPFERGVNGFAMAENGFERLFVAAGTTLTGAVQADLIDFTADTLAGSSGISIDGGAGSDIITGSRLADSIVGGVGSDSLTGGVGDDRLDGGDGNDVLAGGSGTDTLVGGAGRDTYIDPWGDTILEERGGGPDLVMTARTFSLVNVANVENLTLTGGAAIDGAGNSISNTITGNDGANSLFGNGGNDTLIGGGGADILKGGSNADLFELRALTDSGITVASRDTIVDFRQSDHDRIGLADIDADSTAAGNQAFTFSGSSAFSGVRGELHAVTSNGGTLIEGDVDGNRVADFSIFVSGQVNFVAADFVL